MRDRPVRRDPAAVDVAGREPRREHLGPTEVGVAHAERAEDLRRSHASNGSPVTASIARAASVYPTFEYAIRLPGFQRTTRERGLIASAASAASASSGVNTSLKRMSSSPAVCSIACASVTGAAASHALSTPLSGTTSRSGRSRSSLPCSTSRITPRPMKPFVIDAARNTVSRVTGARVVSSATPTPPIQIGPLRSTSAIPAPGTPSRSRTRAIAARSSSIDAGDGAATTGTRPTGSSSTGGTARWRHGTASTPATSARPTIARMRRTPRL